MEKLKLSPAEILKTVQIQAIENDRLDKVFDYLSKINDFFCFLFTLQQAKVTSYIFVTLLESNNFIGPAKPQKKQNFIGEGDIMKTLQFLGVQPTKQEVKLIIWVTSLFKVVRKQMMILTVMSAKTSSLQCKFYSITFLGTRDALVMKLDQNLESFLTWCSS